MDADSTPVQRLGSNWGRDIGFGLLAIAAVAIALVLGQIATFPNLTPWYAGLHKPDFNPPNWLFGPVWTALYMLMAFAVWRILRIRYGGQTQRSALFLFFIQLVLNAAWSWLFFAAHNPWLGMMDILPQFFVLISTVVAFAMLDRTAAWCMVPVTLWVGFAGLLNLEIWRLNG